MKNICLILIFFSLPIFAQDELRDTCSLPTENNNWKQLFETADSKKSKLELVRKKIKNDTIYKKYKPTIPGVSGYLYPESYDKNGNDCGVKILFVLKSSKKEFLILDLSENPNYINVVDNLSQENIDEIIPIFDSKYAQSLYGSFGKSGVIFLDTKNKKLISEIKAVKKKK